MTSPLEFVGAWAFERDIDDRREGRRIQVTGLAEITHVTGGELAWHESGTMQGPDGAVPVAQSRRIVEREPGVWDVLFSDGRFFHEWGVSREIAHDCAPDLYLGRMDPSLGSASWTQVWTVSGPAKNYVSTTHYARSLRDAKSFMTPT